MLDAQGLEKFFIELTTLLIGDYENLKNPNFYKLLEKFVLRAVKKELQTTALIVVYKMYREHCAGSENIA